MRAYARACEARICLHGDKCGCCGRARMVVVPPQFGCAETGSIARLLVVRQSLQCKRKRSGRTLTEAAASGGGRQIVESPLRMGEARRRIYLVLEHVKPLHSFFEQLRGRLDARPGSRMRLGMRLGVRLDMRLGRMRLDVKPVVRLDTRAGMMRRGLRLA